MHPFHSWITFKKRAVCSLILYFPFLASKEKFDASFNLTWIFMNLKQFSTGGLSAYLCSLCIYNLKILPEDDCKIIVFYLLAFLPFWQSQCWKKTLALKVFCGEGLGVCVCVCVCVCSIVYYSLIFRPTGGLVFGIGISDFGCQISSREVWDHSLLKFVHNQFL